MHLAVLLTSLISSGVAVHMQNLASELSRRAPSTCEETYGLGWVQCSGEKDTSCYNAQLGQVSSPSDVDV